MKSSVFTLLAIATMVVSMSSCSQNDGGSSNSLNLKETTTTESVQQHNLGFMVVATDDQLACMNMQFVLSVNGEEKTVSLSDMTEMTDPTQYDNVDIYKNMKELKDAFDQVGGSNSNLKVYNFNFGSFSKASCKVVKVNWTVKEGYQDTEEEVNVANAFGFYSDVKTVNSVTDSQIYKGVDGDKASIASFCDAVNEVGGHSYNF